AISDRTVPGDARPRSPPPLPAERRRARRRCGAARRRLRASSPRAHPRRGRLLGAVRSPEERGRRAVGAVGGVGPSGYDAGAEGTPMKPGAGVLLHLINPTEKFWGGVEWLAPVGVVLR